MPNETVPPLIDCARVLFYAIVDDTFRHVPKGTLYAGGRKIEAVPRLAIVRNLVDDGIMLLHCGDEWESLAVSGVGDVDDLKRQANEHYPGLATKWQKAPYTDVEFAKALADEYRDSRCSFCGRYHFEVGEMPMAQGHEAMICRECVERLHRDLAGPFE
jgi:hypothetical protein